MQRDIGSVPTTSSCLCNRPVCPVYNPYQRDGFMNATDNYGGDPNYVNSSLAPVAFKKSYGVAGVADEKHERWVGSVSWYVSEVTDEDFVQARLFWEMLGKQAGEQEAFISNVSGHLSGAIPSIQDATFGTQPSPSPVLMM